jgi:hypothetical protein
VHVRRPGRVVRAMASTCPPDEVLARVAELGDQEDCKAFVYDAMLSIAAFSW